MPILRQSQQLTSILRARAPSGTSNLLSIPEPIWGLPAPAPLMNFLGGGWVLGMWPSVNLKRKTDQRTNDCLSHIYHIPFCATPLLNRHLIICTLGTIQLKLLRHRMTAPATKKQKLGMEIHKHSHALKLSTWMSTTLTTPSCLPLFCRV